MVSRLFGRTNQNGLLFDIEKQEGSDILEGDEGLASIGDATLAHIQKLTPLQRLAYDEHILMGDGNLFRVTEQPRWEDKDEYNLKHRTADERLLLLAKDKQGREVPPSRREEILEAMEELEMKEDSLDVTNHPETLIPYDQWESFPQMSKYVDIPSTPRPRLQFCGNAKQPFYDDFAWGLGQGDLKDGCPHPMASFISGVIATLDRFYLHEIITEEEIASRPTDAKPLFHQDNSPFYILTDTTTEYLNVNAYIEHLEFRLFPKPQENRVARHKKSVPFEYRKVCFEAITEAILNLSKADGPVVAITLALQKIESHWFNHYRSMVIRKTKEWDPLYIFIAKKGKEWISRAKNGEKVLHEVATFGRDLFSNGFLSTRKIKEKVGKRKNAGPITLTTSIQEARPHHWKKYQAIKQELARLAHNRYRTSVSIRAQKVLDYVAVMASRVYVKMESGASVPDEEKNYEIDRVAFKKYVEIPNALLQASKIGTLSLTDREWRRVWSAYSSGRSAINSHTRGIISS